MGPRGVSDAVSVGRVTLWPAMKRDGSRDLTGVLRTLVLGLGMAVVVCGVSAQQETPAQRFYQAIRSDDLSTLRALVREHGTHSTDTLGQTPLMLAAAFGSAEATELLVTAGADVKAVSKGGVTALHWAVRDARKVRWLLDRGADVHARTTLGRTPLLVAASTSGTATVVELLLDRGAGVNAADTAGITPLVAAASVDDISVARLLLARGADPDAKAQVGQSATAIMGAAYNGNVELTRLLLARKVDLHAISADRTGTVKNGPVQFGNVTALHMATASGNRQVVELFLDAGAAVDALDVRGMTPLMWSVSTDRPEPRVIRLLLGRGADRNVQSRLTESAVDWARKFNHPEVLAELKLRAADMPIGAPAASHDSRLTARHAVERSLPLLQRASARMLTDGGCVACHAQPVTAMAANLAKGRSWSVEQTTELVQMTATLTAAAPALLQAREGGGLPDTQLYNAIVMDALAVPPSFATDALVHYLAAKQRADGSWHGVGATRAPIQDGDFSRTAMSIKALSAYGTPALRGELTQRIERAASWLARQTPHSTEDRVMQLLGLKWANAKAESRQALTRELQRMQRSDGGWAQTPYLASDAYATGQVVFTLREMGLAATDPVVERGAAYLLRTQHEDGSWYVKSRAMKIQPYFESGFPHGHDQWISQTGTAWAVMALSLT